MIDPLSYCGKKRPPLKWQSCVLWFAVAVSILFLDLGVLVFGNLPASLIVTGITLGTLLVFSARRSYYRYVKWLAAGALIVLNLFFTVAMGLDMEFAWMAPVALGSILISSTIFARNRPRLRLGLDLAAFFIALALIGLQVWLSWRRDAAYFV